MLSGKEVIELGMLMRSMFLQNANIDNPKTDKPSSKTTFSNLVHNEKAPSPMLITDFGI